MIPINVIKENKSIRRFVKYLIKSMDSSVIEWKYNYYLYIFFNIKFKFSRLKYIIICLISWIIIIIQSSYDMNNINFFYTLLNTYNTYIIIQ